MAQRLRILHLEDDPRDSEIMTGILRTHGVPCDIVRVDTREAYLEHLEHSDFDVIIADLTMPGFDGIAAQEIWQQRRSAVPFIFLSGTFGEEAAVERLRSGATDYVLKSWIEKLPAVVLRAHREARDRVGHHHGQEDLERLTAELEQRVEERTAQLGAANHALMESERRFFDILDRSPAAIFLKDLDGRYMFVNRRCQEVVRKTRQEMIGHSDAELLPRPMAEMFGAHDRKVMETGAALDFEETWLPDAGPQPRIFFASRFPLRDLQGRVYALCGITSDVTERKRVDEEMKTARKEAERANRAKSDFLSRMSHDLRTPLNAVLGFAQLLDMDTLSEDQRDSVIQILEAGRQLLNLMNEVLDISRVEAGHLSLTVEAVSVSGMLEQVVKLLKPLAARRHIDFELVSGPIADRYVRADRQRLNQILINLVSNAIKYNREHGRVTLSCEDVADGRIRLNVIDTGPGLAPEKIALLFTPFERLGADQQGIEGTGLGLTLSRGLAEAMGGSLGVDSRLDHGSRFWVELPGSMAPGAETIPVAPQPLRIAATDVSGKVLYIEDNASNVRLVERLLKQRRPGVTLLNARDGERGLAMAVAHQPNLIFLDLHLPDTTGEEVLRRLSADNRTRNIPVAVLTADATASQNRRLLAAGATAYLTKPLDVTSLLSLLDERLTA